MTMRKILLILIPLLFAVTCCKQKARTSDPMIFPDYTDITIPANIAPLNFKIEGVSRIETVVEGRGFSKRFIFLFGHTNFPVRSWHKMLSQASGDTLKVRVSAKIGGKQVSLREFFWAVRPEPIDKYLSYRLIEPCYEVWNDLSIEERDLESFRIRTIADNSNTGTSCMNCHISNRAENPVSFLHARSKGGGTIYNRGGLIRKIDTASDSTDGPAVYGEISANGRFGVFTTARIRPILNSSALGRLEVYDSSSDLILIDFERSTITDSPLVKGKEFQETFPCWNAANDRVYFCRAKSLPQPDSTKYMHYNLYSIDFDAEQGRFGQDLRLEFDAEAIGKSVSFPKCSPDGRHLLMSVSDYGTFPIWHVETDLWMLDLQTGKIDKMENTNGEYSDSYHCWSTNGRWICWASKRGDRVYGRPYFAYVNEDGSTTKAFVLPQRNPEHYIETLKSYNIPELYNSPEIYGAHDISRMYRKMECEKLQYVCK